ncbi:MAG: hypothetical protein AAF436_07785 [Myxococcota bacterium]
MPTRALLVCAWALAFASPETAFADSLELTGTAPERVNLSFSVGIEVGLVIPVATKPLCPSGAECLFGAGAAIGIPLSYRWNQGTELGFDYEFWILNSDGVYEAAVAQAFTALLRQSFLVDRSVRPVLRARGGLLLLGPTFGVDTLGGTLELAFGGEAEMNRNMLFSFTLGGQLLWTQPFTTSSDGVARSQDGGVNAALVLRIGIHYLL